VLHAKNDFGDLCIFEFVFYSVSSVLIGSYSQICIYMLSAALNVFAKLNDQTVSYWRVTYGAA